MGVGEMEQIIGKTGVGEMGVGEMGVILRIMAANKVRNYALSSPNSVYNGMSIGNSFRHNYFSETITIVLLRLQDRDKVLKKLNNLMDR